MKIKGISIVEQHIEKLVLGLALIALVVVTAMQFVGRPNEVSMGGRQVNPGDVDRLLEERASELNAKLRDEAPPALDPLESRPPLVEEAFNDALAGGVSPASALALLEPALAGDLMPIDLGTDTWYYEPVIPRATILANVTQTADALDPAALQQYPELQSRFEDPAGPLDIVWTTPAATIDVVGLRDELRRSLASADPPRLQVPTPWYNDSTFIADVSFEREELMPDGSWGNRVEVSTIPGQVTFRPRLTESPDASLRNEIFSRLADPAAQRAVIQPDFLPTRNNSFIAPQPVDPDAVDDGLDDEVADLKRTIATRQAQREQLWAQLTELGGPLEEEGRSNNEGDGDGNRGRGRGGTPPPGGGGGLSGGGGGGLSGGFGGGNRGGRGSGIDPERRRKQRIGLTKRVVQEDALIARLQEELKELAPDAVMEGVAEVQPLDLNADETVVVWAHDIEVDPGHTYRYRAAIRIYNPFFARKRQLVTDQQPLSDDFVILSEFSDWSSPVEVTPPVAFFLARANPGDGPMSLGSASFEVYRLHDGRWQREQFVVNPGDRIGRVVTPGRGREGEPTVDYSTDWYVVDVVEDQAADRSGMSDTQRTGIVVIEQLGTGERIELRDPRGDQLNSDRKRLNREWKVGELS